MSLFQYLPSRIDTDSIKDHLEQKLSYFCFSEIVYTTITLKCEPKHSACNIDDFFLKTKKNANTNYTKCESKHSARCLDYLLKVET